MLSQDAMVANVQEEEGGRERELTSDCGGDQQHGTGQGRGCAGLELWAID